MEYDLTLWHGLLLVATGLIAGFINTFAGGGSFLTIPALMLTGMPADIANATNRVSVMVTALEGMRGFHQHKVLPTQAIVGLLIPCLTGSLIGALMASYLPVIYLKPIILTCLITMAVWMVFSPTSFIPSSTAQPLSPLHSAKGFGGLFIAGVYGGFIQAGVGFILVAALVGALHYDLVRANALKMVTTAIFTTIALVIFIARDQVLWLPGIILGIASMVGAWFGVRFAIKVNQKVLRWLLLIAVIGASLAIGFG